MPALKCIYEKSLNKGSRGMQRQQVRASKGSKWRVHRGTATLAHLSLLDFKWCLLWPWRKTQSQEKWKCWRKLRLLTHTTTQTHTHTKKRSWSTWLKDDVEWRNRWTSQQEEQRGEEGREACTRWAWNYEPFNSNNNNKQRRTSTTSLSCLKQAIGKGVREWGLGRAQGGWKSESVKDAAAVS